MKQPPIQHKQPHANRKFTSASIVHLPHRTLLAFRILTKRQTHGSGASLKKLRLNSNVQLARGFTLVEALVSIAILSLGVTGTIVLLAGATSQIYEARDRMIASYLANEGMELIRQRRDSNIRQPVSWDSGIGPGDCPGGPINGCVVSILERTTGAMTDPPEIVQCTGPCSFDLYKNPQGFYGNKATGANWGTPTPFSRKVNISGGGDEHIVTVTVTYNSGEVILKESIFNLQG